MSLNDYDRHFRPALTRRDVLVRAANGFGAIALGSLLEPPARAAERVNALAAKPPHFKPKAKSVIFLFMVGAPSHIDTFDPKPALEKYDGKLLPASYGTVISEFTKGDTPLLRSPWKFNSYGQCGRQVSTLFPHIAQHVDDLCFVRSFYTESTVHAPAMYQVNTGRILMGYPSMGSWITYGLGSESENLPAYVVMPQPEGTPEGGTPCWGAGFLPAVYQGTVFRPGPNPIVNLRPPAGVTPERQRRTLDFLQSMNEMDTLDSDTEMAARISSYELAFRMQSHAPEAVDMSKESAATRALYGLDQKHTSEFGNALFFGAQAGGARRAVCADLFGRRSGLGAVGRAQQPGGESREDERHDGPAGRRSAGGSKAARVAGIDASDLGAEFGACRCRKAATDATIIRTGTPCGLPAAA